MLGFTNANVLIGVGRWASIVFSVLMLVYLVKILAGYLFFDRREPYPSSLWIMSAMIVMTISIFFNQTARIKDASDLTWRLPVDVVALMLGAYAVRRREKELRVLNSDIDARQTQVLLEQKLRSANSNLSSDRKKGWL